ncbi:MAG: hypothetical protein K8R58_11050 [Bacteroidales bacterium]|nr:hypothetical protein [Bacteroidales bacterium]
MATKIIYTKSMITITLVLCFQIAISNTPIGTSSKSTATERNNARLIVEDHTGKLHVVFYDSGIYYSTSIDGGVNWSYPVTLVDNIGRNPSIAVDSDNILHLVYKYGDISAHDIVHRTCQDGVWSNLEIVHYSAAAPLSRPVIAIDSENNLHCVWQRSGAGATPNSEIHYKKYTVGTGWDINPTNISNSYGASEYPTLTIDHNDNVHVFWKDSGENIGNDKMVLYRKYTVGIGWDANYTNISNTSGNGSWATMDPCALVDMDGNIHLVWKDSQPGNREIFYKKCTAGVWSTNPANLSNTANSSMNPTISIDAFGNLFVFWAEKANGINYDIVYKKCEISTNTWTGITNISNTSQADSKHPNSPIKTNNSLFAVWTEGEGNPYQIMFHGLTYDVTDIGVIAMNSPFSDCELSNSEQVIIELENFGTTSINTGESISVGFSYNNNPFVNETIILQNDFIPNDTLIYTFSQTADLSSPNIYSFEIYCNYNDDNPSNDTLYIEVEVYGLPTVDLGADTIFTSQPDTIILDAGSGFISYLWQDGSTGQTYNVPDYGDYWVIVTDENGCQGCDTIIVCNFSEITVDLIVFLEGPYFGTEMNTYLNPDYIPLSQPYNIAPWNYTGTESVATIPNTDIVDWVLVELRDTTEAQYATGSTMIAQQAAFLLNDGSVVGLDGIDAISCVSTTITNNLFVVIWHRNHLGVLSAYSLTETGGVYSYNFSTGANQSYGGSLGHKEISTGVWGMIGGDGNADNQIGNADKNDIWEAQAGSSGYLSGDFSMDGQCNNTDKVEVWAPNSGSGGQVPE